MAKTKVGVTIKIHAQRTYDGDPGTGSPRHDLRRASASIGGQCALAAPHVGREEAWKGRRCICRAIGSIDIAVVISNPTFKLA